MAAKLLQFGFTTKIAHPSERSKLEKGAVKVARFTDNMTEDEKLNRKAIVKINLKVRKSRIWGKGSSKHALNFQNLFIYTL